MRFQTFFLIISVSSFLRAQAWIASYPTPRTQTLLHSNNEANEMKDPLESLSILLCPNEKCNPTQLSPTSLAYIGDSVFELFVRSRYVWPNRRTTDLQNLVVGRVRAEAQSKMFRELLSSESFTLTQEEQNIVKRGRNAGSSSGGRKRGPKRLYSSNDGKNGGGPEVYQDSTAIEALIGYMYLTSKERCVELLEYFNSELDKLDDAEGVVR